MKRILKEHKIMLLGYLISIILLIIFFILLKFLPSSLTLDIKWIVVAFIPLIIALIIGGYVRVIKGFGTELELRIQEPISTLDLKIGEVLTSSEGISKRTLDDFYRVSPERKSRVTRLQFTVNRKDYYDPWIIADYIRSLPKLEYFEVTKSNGAFLCLLPIFPLFSPLNENRDDFQKFVESLESNHVLDIYKDYAITGTIASSQNIIEALTLLRKKGLAIAAVLEGTRMIGVIKTSDIEKRIADEVLFESEKRKK